VSENSGSDLTSRNFPAGRFAVYGEKIKYQQERNKELVRNYYHLSLHLKRPEEATAKYLGPYYRQHNPGTADEAVPFDPSSLPEPELEGDLEERRIGGLGVFLIRQVMDEVSYRHEDGKNILSSIKQKKD